MNILLISQCSKRALTETRRILDQFAERRGDRTWQTAMTQAGLDTLCKLLRQSARKNTAVACHWIHGRDHSELLWVVGDARQFNPQGAVPTNTTANNVLRVDDENSWHSLQLMQRISALAALLHDVGKASDAFQERLRGTLKDKNLYRHEWTSVRLFQAFVTSCGDLHNDQAWLQQLATCDGQQDTQAWEQQWIGPHLLRDGIHDALASVSFYPFKALPPLAQAVTWLILTHHRLPAMPSHADHTENRTVWHGQALAGLGVGDIAHALGKINANWNEPYTPEQRQTQKIHQINPYWKFTRGLPVTLPAWRKRAARMAQHLLKQALNPGDKAVFLDNTYVMHLARLALMLGDHYYSSLTDQQQRVAGDDKYTAFANTSGKDGKLLQKLDEHLLGVESHTSQIVHALPSLTRQLPHLYHHKRLKMRSQHPLFRWQDKAADLAASVRQRAAEHGAFIVNMASTGCGKTLGNARIMNALAHPQQGMRCAFAIGLRTLTLQTGRSFQNDLGLGEDQLAIQVGGAASRELFDFYEKKAEQTGSASRQHLLDETTHVVFEGNEHHPVLQHLGHDHGARKLVAAPVLVCTVDHLTPATESLRGGRQIAPMLRLMTSDLVLDEPDDFDLADLPALTRLVHWAGLLGSRVLLSSATLPPALVQGLFLAYLEGRRGFQRNRGERPSETVRIPCLWMDEFNQHHAECANATDFDAQHLPFATQRHAKLGSQILRRRAQLLALPTNLSNLSPSERRSEFANVLHKAALRLHTQHHSIDPHTSKRISFGLIRMANIRPLFDVALALFQQDIPVGTHIHLCVYHSQFPLFLRSAIEHRLDHALNRRQEHAVFDLPRIRQAIDSHEAHDQLFIVLGSPVTEVGRDHDYDWAVVEPSSVRSLIQLAGRVLRHRTDKTIEHPNLLVCDTNLRHFESRDGLAYCKPGFESKGFSLDFHDLQHLLAPWLDEQQQMSIDARPRIMPRPLPMRQPNANLVDLEHHRMDMQMLPPSKDPAVPLVSNAPIRQNRLARRNADTSSSTAVAPFIRLNASSFWQRGQLNLTATLQQTQPFRHDTQTYEEVALLPTEEEDDYLLHRVVQDKNQWQRYYDIWEGKLSRVADEAVTHVRISPWGTVNFMQAMHTQAQNMDMPLRRFADKFATVTLATNKRNNQGWQWHPWLGFVQKD